TEKVEVGPILDVVPYVLSDGYTINLTVIPSLTEFLGYDKPPYPNAVHVAVPVVLPKFRTRQIVTTLNVWDGQTVVLGNFLNDGKEVTGQPSVDDKELLVFITVTIIDPAGNRVHADDE